MARRSTEDPALLAGLAGALFLALAPGMPGGSGIRGQDVPEPLRPPYAEVPDRGVRPAFGWVTEQATEAAGLPLLHRAALPPSHREIRAWIGFGLVLPHTLVRIVEGPGGVRGELYQWWESFEDPEEEPSMGIREWLDAAPGSVACRHRPSGNVRTTVHAGGRRSDASGRMWVCRVAPPPGGDPDWREVMGGLDSLRAFELPDPPADDPEGQAGPDGIALQVEVLAGDSYRTYRYSNPGWRPSPRARHAAGIMELLQRVSSVLLGR